MGRKHTFFDRTFNRADYDPFDQGEFEPNTVFVIMPFAGEEMDRVYAVIERVCRTLGLAASRADQYYGSGMIIGEITESIEQAEFIICDLSFERPNVYYELGYAHGVGNEEFDLLLIAKEGTVLHFDIAPLRTQYYSSIEDLETIVSRGLQQMIARTRRGG